MPKPRVLPDIDAPLPNPTQIETDGEDQPIPKDDTDEGQPEPDGSEQEQKPEPSPESDGSAEEPVEETSDFNEWKKQFDMPELESVNSPEEMIDLIKKMKETSPDLTETKPEPVEQPPVSQPQTGAPVGQSPFWSMSEIIDNAVNAGFVDSNDPELSMAKRIARMFDEVNKYNMNLLSRAIMEAHDQIKQLGGTASSLKSNMTEGEYREFQKEMGSNRAFPKTQLDKVREKFPGINYSQAQFFLVSSDPKLRDQYLEQYYSNRSASDRKRQQFQGKFKFMKPSGKPSGGSALKEHGHYFDADGNPNASFNKLSDAEQTIILGKRIKELKSGG